MKHVLSEYILNILMRKIRKNIHSDGIMSQQKYNLDFFRFIHCISLQNYFTFMHICASCLCLVFSEFRRRHGSPGWSYRCL